MPPARHHPDAAAVRTTRRRGVVFAHVRGEVDTANYDVVRAELLGCLDNASTALVVDLADVEFFGSMGIAVLVEVREHVDRLGMGFAVAAGHRVVVNPMRVTQVERLLTLRPTLEDAIAAVERPRDGGFSWWSP
ncbi:hypothetical protein SUDANB95_02063 [Actinosynnema sp. ALI-1.44]